MKTEKSSEEDIIRQNRGESTGYHNIIFCTLGFFIIEGLLIGEIQILPGLIGVEDL